MKPNQDGLRLARARLIGFCALMLLAGAVFLQVAGPPRAPGALPGLGEVLPVLAGASLPVAQLTNVLVDGVWLLWIWIFGSLCIELFISIAEVIAHGAAWVRSLRRIADRCSAPLARKAVAAAFAVQLVSRGVPLASAQTLNPTEIALVASAPKTSNESVAEAEQEPTGPTYLVREGDTLWSIAESAYGSGEAYRQIIDANVGQQMADGKVFTAQGVIRPGWELRLPGADLNAYVVKPGDTLSSVAATRLGDTSRWTELYDENRGLETPDGSHALSDPNVIWPGLRLRIPTADAAPVAAAAPETEQPPEQVAAAAPAQTTEAAEPPADTLSPHEADVPPLLRTPHALDPVALEPVDAPAPDLEADTASLPDETGPGGADVSSVPTTPSHVDLPTTPLAAGALGLVVVAGLAYGAHRMRRRLRPLPQEPESEVVVEGGFAEAQLAQDLTRGLHGAGFDPLGALMGRLEQFLLEYNLVNVGVVAVRHGRSSTTITLRCALSEQALVLDLAPVFAERIGADIQAWVSPDQDVALQLTRVRRTRLLPSADRAELGPGLVSLGVLYDRQIYSAAWEALGHVLIASVPGHGADTIVTSLVATLTARRSPQQLRLWMLAAPRVLPAPLYDLPHLEKIVDVTDPIGLASVVDELRAELDRRASEPGSPDLAVVIPELATLGEHADTFAMLASGATERGVHFVCASMVLDQVVMNPLTSQLTTRMVLRMHDEEMSVALLGVADAAFLSGGGRLVVRVDGREPVELYGYQVSAEHLERLVKVMRSPYQPVPAPAQPVPVAPPDPPAHAQSDPQIEDIQPEEEEAPVAPAAPAEAVEHLDATRAPIEVTCFGGQRVLCGGQEVWPTSVTGDAKPWELLLYVACQPAEGVAKDVAVEALWPEDEAPEDASHRIRQLRYRLRRLLLAAPSAPETEGICLDRGKLRLDPGTVYSDVQEFLTLLGTARTLQGSEAIHSLARARELYTGDLLEGPQARRYAWVTERDASGVTLREHFRRLFQQATRRLAELYQTNAMPDLALELWRELSDMDPGDEQVWLALLRLHAERGDRLGLMHEERRMRESLSELAEDFGPGAEEENLPELSREFTLEYQRLLASLGERERATA